MRKIASAGVLGWYPMDPAFRKAFLALLSEALLHVRKHGDASYILKLMNGIPDRYVRAHALNALQRLFPVKLSHDGGRISLDKSRLKSFDWSSADISKLFPAKIKLSGNMLLVGDVGLSPHEFAQEVADALVLGRKHFTPEDLRSIRDTVDQILRRNAEGVK